MVASRCRQDEVDRALAGVVDEVVVWGEVVRHRRVSWPAPHGDADGGDNVIAVEPCHEDAAGVERLGALDRVAQSDGGKPEQGRLLGDRS